MKKSLFSGVALAAMMAFSGAAWAEILIGVAGPVTGPNAVATPSTGMSGARASRTAGSSPSTSAAIWARTPTAVPQLVRHKHLLDAAVASFWPGRRKEGMR